MANTISLSASVSLKRDGDITRMLFNRNGVSLTQAGEGLASAIQNIGTSAENINVGDVATEGLAMFENLDTTNYVEIGWDASGFLEAFKIPAGLFAIVQLSASRTWQARANTAAIELLYTVLEA